MKVKTLSKVNDTIEITVTIAIVMTMIAALGLAIGIESDSSLLWFNPDIVRKI